jgi:hypothetical protein
VPWKKAKELRTKDGKEKKGSDGERARWCELGTGRSARGKDGETLR